jgi:hypothetical protein
MRITINNLEPCPRNRSHAIVSRGKFAQLIKTEAARMYESALKKLLAPYKKDRDSFFDKFDPNKHGIKTTYIHGSPDFLTKSGKINLNSVDLDAHKILKDVIAEFLGINDGYVICSTDIKCLYPQHILIIDIDIVSNGIEVPGLTNIH